MIFHLVFRPNKPQYWFIQFMWYLRIELLVRKAACGEKEAGEE